jgi:3'(2'), 5'-bisphosphate nucleotidase
MAYEKERQVAIDAILKACALCRSVQSNLVTAATLDKKDNSPVTVADFGAQAVVSLDLLSAFPADPLVGEEDASELRETANAALAEKVVSHVRGIAGDVDGERVLSAIDHGTYEGGRKGRHWTLDPIDGTQGFLRGDQYAVALALIEDGRVVLGGLGCPNLSLVADNPNGQRGCVFVAVRGQGAFMLTLENKAERRITASAISDPAEASFCESVESGHTSHDEAAQVAERLGVKVPPYRIDSQCKYAAVARGDASIYLRLPTRPGYEEKIWDHAAGWIVVQEAGGSVTDTRGTPLDFSIGRTLKNNKGVVATNGKVHDQVIAAVMQVLK